MAPLISPPLDVMGYGVVPGYTGTIPSISLGEGDNSGSVSVLLAAISFKE